MPFKSIYFTLLVFLCIACGRHADDEKLDEDRVDQEVISMGFQQLSAEQTGITFTNTISETETFNYFKYEDIYSGGGVGIGDVNNDGLCDIYFTGNQVSDKLYLNKGDLQFEDITASAFNEDLSEGWSSGVNMVDINSDGWLDIYVCKSGDVSDRSLFQNKLYVNNQDNTFSEKAAEYGLNIEKRTMNTVFFDYDNDGDLDAYLLNHPHQLEQKIFSREEALREKTQGIDSDSFLENQDGIYVDVSEKVGVRSNMFGLGIGVSDIDGNGYQDIYISNDYQDPDLLLMNNGDGTFSEEIKESTNHISNFSMGNDVADFNNDGFVDVVTVDMVSEDHVRSKKNMGGMSTENFWDIVNIVKNFSMKRLDKD